MTSQNEKRLLKMLECPVCLTYMVPPIYKCVAGHHICYRCDARISRCPLCRGPRGGRDLVMEEMSMSTEFPCLYTSEGCKFSAMSYMVKWHEIGCHFSWRMCPFFKLRTCNWTGHFKDLMTHFTEKHRELMYFNAAHKFMLYRMAQRTSFQSLVIIHVYNTNFLLRSEFDRAKNLFRFCVTYYGFPGKASKFSYILSILDGDAGKEVVRMSAPIYCVMEDDASFMKNVFFVAVHFQLIKDCISSEGDLQFALKILDKDSVSS